LYETTASSDCPEGMVYSSVYSFYAAFDNAEEMNEEPEQPTSEEVTETPENTEPELNVVMIHAGMVCRADEENMGYILDI
jgi:hypothetical protein